MAIKIGKYIIHTPVNGKIWISHEDGEGGEFDAAALAQEIEAFYLVNF